MNFVIASVQQSSFHTLDTAQGFPLDRNHNSRRGHAIVGNLAWPHLSFL